MGVPKFYRWISERYPNMSRVISDNQIPDFDNFYLDMNGIIHQCSHINEDNCEINVTEEEIFRNIFHYLDFLFRMIKPKKVFFMAIDGVAPRAKMNQQRARRFRAGKDRIKKLKILADKTGRTFEETASKHFDTNAITPGTQFMANLDEQLRYFIHVKLTTDPLWENVDVHLSGHLTPGEGEHKIMEFIRYTRSQPGYNVNTRHCLYGLDADLIMLGLVTHEMHFALLREEVKFGSKKISKILAPEEITWHLLHTCLLRDYIDLEFRSLREKLKFPYDLDRIVDDWILMAYLVGNDFIPHLPHIHINEEALSILWDIYKFVLPTLDGYLNESGDLNLTRFEIYLIELAKLDRQRYANENDSFKYLDKLNKRKRNSSKTKSQSEQHDDFDLAILDKLSIDEKLESKSPEIVSISDDNELSSDSSTIDDESDDDDEKKKTSIKHLDEYDLDNLPLIDAEFRQHKNNYYREKMKLNITSMNELQVYANEYIEALQWILKYYYQGCPSWSWFYPHHYAPYLSDLKNFKDLNIQFKKGTPFQPFEQLLSVLPPTSRQLLPVCLQSLMTDPQSPLVDFYPENFQLDQNEKKQDWEAIVLLPFIDEELLLSTINKSYSQLTSTEQTRNQHIPSLCFHTREHLQPVGDSLKPNPYFPMIKESRAGWREFSIDYEKFTLDQIKFGRFDDKEMILFPKFPILNVLPYKYAFKSNAVNLFEARSRTTTLVLSLTHQSDRDLITYNDQWNPKGENHSPPFEIKQLHSLIERYLGKRVFVNWPHIQYGIVCAISDYRKVYLWSDIPDGSYFYSEPIDLETNFDLKNFTQSPVYVCDHPFEISNENNSKKKTIWQTIPLKEKDTEIEYLKALNLNRYYENRQGVSIGPIPLLLYVSPLIGYRTVCSSKSDKCRTNLCFSNQVLAYPLQTTLFQVPNYQSTIDPMPQTINDYLKINDQIFALQTPFYSSLGYVEGIHRDKHGNISISCRLEATDQVKQPDVYSSASKLQQHQLRYYTAQDIADQLKTIPSVVSKLTGNVSVLGNKRARKRPNPTNVGLSWKVNKPAKQLHGYTRKIDQVWYYSEAVIPILTEYMMKFPEIVEELKKKPKEDNYYEKNIWPDKKPKHELQEVRKWMKSLSTYTIPLTDASWEVLDAPVINEVEKLVKSFYIKQAAKNIEKKMKTISLDPAHIFKADESIGMCNPDRTAQFCLFDRVVSVRLGTGVPLGTRGTVIGIMHGGTNLDTYYEILFDSLPENTLESILLGKNQQKCRIKVRSYHLLNYSHSLRMRSTNYQQQQSIPSLDYGSNQYSNRTRMPRSAPPMTTNERPIFNQENNSKPPRFQQYNQQTYPSENAIISMNTMGTTQTAMPVSPSNIAFYPAMQNFSQFEYTAQYYGDSPMSQMQTYPISPSNYPFQPGVHQLNPMTYNSASSFSLYQMAPSVPINYPQQQQQQQQQVSNIATQNLPPVPNSLAMNSTLSCDAQPFQPQQSTSIRPPDKNEEN